MGDEVVFRKTAKGEDVVKLHSFNLAVRLRSLLISVDGKRDVSTIKRGFSTLGDVSAMLGELEQLGCIEKVSPAATVAGPAAVQPLNKEAKQYMASYLYDALGPESDSLVRKVEKSKTNEDLSQVLDDSRVVLRAMGKPGKADEFWAMGQEMLNGSDGSGVKPLNIEAKTYMASYLYDALGPESDSLVRKVEKCKTNEDLSLLLDDCRAVLRSMGKPAKAEEFWTMGREMLA